MGLTSAQCYCMALVSGHGAVRATQSDEVRNCLYASQYTGDSTTHSRTLGDSSRSDTTSSARNMTATMPCRTGKGSSRTRNYNWMCQTVPTPPTLAHLAGLQGWTRLKRDCSHCTSCLQITVKPGHHLLRLQVQGTVVNNGPQEILALCVPKSVFFRHNRLAQSTVLTQARGRRYSQCHNRGSSLASQSVTVGVTATMQYNESASPAGSLSSASASESS